MKCKVDVIIVLALLAACAGYVAAYIGVRDNEMPACLILLVLVVNWLIGYLNRPIARKRSE